MGDAGWFAPAGCPGNEGASTVCYTAPMTRFGPAQPDLFAPAAAPPAVPSRPPLEELAELLAYLRAAQDLPWPDAAATMVEEWRALSLARIAGPEGAILATAILQETERLLASAEQQALEAAMAARHSSFMPEAAASGAAR